MAMKKMNLLCCKAAFCVAFLLLVETVSDARPSPVAMEPDVHAKSKTLIYHVALTSQEASSTGLSDFDRSVRRFYENKLAKELSTVWPRRIWYVGANAAMLGLSWNRIDRNSTHQVKLRDLTLYLASANFAIAPGLSYFTEKLVDLTQNLKDPEYHKMKGAFDKVKNHADLSCRTLGGKRAKIRYDQDFLPLMAVSLKSILRGSQSGAQVYLDGSEVLDREDYVLVFNKPIICDMGNYFEPLNDLIKSQKIERG